MTEPDAPPEPEPPPEAREGLGGRLWRAVFAPDVLEDGGRDTPLTPRGRILFWGTIVVLVLAVGTLFVITLAER